MDSDDVNDIADTEESLQVVDIIEDTYFFILEELDPPHIKQIVRLDNYGDVNQPTRLVIPSNVSEIYDIKYETTSSGDSNRSFRNIRYLEPEEFIDKVLTRSSGNSEVTESYSPSGTPLFFFNDRFPYFWTSFDDENVIFDSYDQNESTTLLGSKTQVLGRVIPVFDKEDNTFTPDLPEKYFPKFLADCKRACHIYLKQGDSPIDAGRSLKGTHTIRNKKWKAHDTKKTVSFGRK